MGIANESPRPLHRPVFLLSPPLPLPRRPSAVVHSSFAPGPSNVGCIMANRSFTAAHRPPTAGWQPTPAIRCDNGFRAGVRARRSNGGPTTFAQRRKGKHSVNPRRSSFSEGWIGAHRDRSPVGKVGVAGRSVAAAARPASGYELLCGGGG